MILKIGRIMPRAKGIYKNTDLYEKLDLVSHGNSLWIANEDINAGEEPGVSTKWVLFLTGGLTTATPNSIFYTDSNGNIETLSFDIGKLIYDNTNKLHFVPDVPPPPTGGYVPLRVKYLGKDLGRAYPLVTVISNTDSVYSWGTDASGASTGILGQSYTPQKISNPADKTGEWVMVQSSARTIIALTSTGELWGRGDNTSKALGEETVYNEWILLATDIIDAQVDGYSQTYIRIIALTSDGRCLTSGADYYERLGRDVTTNEPISKLCPVIFNDLPSDAKIVKIARREGKWYTGIIVLSDENRDNAYCWGRNAYGELGLNHKTIMPLPVKLIGVGHFTDVAMLCVYSSYATAIAIINGKSYASGRNYYHCGDSTTTQRLVFTGTTDGYSGYVKITGSDSYVGNVMATTSNNNVHRWGHNGGVGSLGIGVTTAMKVPANETTHPSEVDGKVANVDIAGRYSYSFSVVRCTDGTVYMAGYDGRRQQGISPNGNKPSFHKIPTSGFVVDAQCIANDATVGAVITLNSEGFVTTHGAKELCGNGDIDVRLPVQIQPFSN